jgi:hypothetical protein
MSWFIKYPDKLEGQALLQTLDPPVDIVPVVSANIDALLAANGSQVKARQQLAVLESGADWNAMMMLEKWLNQRKGKSIAEQRPPLNSTGWKLGPVSSAFNNYTQAVERWIEIFQAPRIPQKIAALKSESRRLEELFSSLERQETIYQKEFELLQKDLKRAELLLASQTISEVEWEQKTNAMLQGKQQLERYQTEKIQNHLSREQLTAQIQELTQDRRQALFEQQQAVTTAAEALEQSLADWKQQYIIRSPGDGRLSWSSGLVNGSFAAAGTTMGTLSPSQRDNPIVIRCWVPVLGTGRLELGNTVQLQLDKYPHEEYGVLEGQLSHIAALPEMKGEYQTPMYELTASVDTPLVTNYQKNIPFQQNSPGRALVITKERRLLERFLDKLKRRIN